MGKEAPFYNKDKNILKREGQLPSRSAICKALLPQAATVLNCASFTVYRPIFLSSEVILYAETAVQQPHS